MSTDKKYARISSPPIRTARNGVRYVRPFDILRSDKGIEDIKSYADAEVVEENRSASQKQAADVRDSKTKSQ